MGDWRGQLRQGTWDMGHGRLEGSAETRDMGHGTWEIGGVS